MQLSLDSKENDMLVVPAVHRFPDLPEYFRKWGWHKVADIVEAHNNLQSDPANHINAGNLFVKYSHLNLHTRVVDTGYMLGKAETFFSYRDGVLKEWGSEEYGLSQTVVILRDEDYVPAGWGMAILKANPIRTFVSRILSVMK
jgi:hypothetical protein